MNTNCIFTKSFYTDKLGDSYELLESGSITKSPSPQETFFQKCKVFLLGRWVDPKTLAVANRIKQIIEKVQSNDWTELQKEIHDHGARGFNIFQVTFSHLLDSCERKNPSLLVIGILKIYSFIRTIFKYTPIEIPMVPKFFISKGKKLTFLSILKNKALQLSSEERNNCQVTLEVLKGNSGKLTVENVQKLECKLRRSIPVEVDPKKKFFIHYSQKNKEFRAEVNASSFSGISMYPKKKEIKVLAEMSLKEDEQPVELKQKIAIEPKKNGADYQIVYTKHVLKPGSVYTIQTNTGALQFKLNRVNREI